MRASKSLQVLAVSFVASLLALPAHAIFRAYLASDGSDANPCTLVAPCRLLPAALAAVDSGGEIWMLDSANYNTASVSIAKSVSILSVPGSVGSILAIGGPAINVTTASLKISLRNVVIGNLAGAGGTDGIAVSGSRLILEDSVVQGVPQRGVYVTGVGGKMHVVNSTIRNTGNYAFQIEGGAVGVASGSQFINNTSNVIVLGTVAGVTTATVTNCVISGGDIGVGAIPSAGGMIATLAMTGSTVEGTLRAVYAETLGAGFATVTVGRNAIFDNGYIYYKVGVGASVVSHGDNQYAGASSTALGTVTAQGSF